MIKIFFLLVWFQSLSANASLLLEPHVGYSMGNHKFTHIDGEQEQGSIDGIAYGGRAGWMFGGIFVGGEYQASRTQRKTDGIQEGINWSNTSIFGVLGFQSKMGLRISAGMTVQPHVSEESTTPERTRFIGSARKLSVGYSYRIPLALNVDYIEYELEKYEVGGMKGDLKELFSKTNYSAILVSISFPLQL